MRGRPAEAHGGVLQEHGDGALAQGADEENKEGQEDVAVAEDGQEVRLAFG